MTAVSTMRSNPLEHLKENYTKLKNWPKINKFDIRELLRAGFTYEESGADNDVLKCVACGVKLFDWQPGDEPVQAHKDYYPECEYIQDVKDKKKETVNPLQHEHMSTLASRLSSYGNWPRAITVSVNTLADAGFFYSGVGDKVTCYYCDGQLKDWKCDEDPWVEHAYWFPPCLYVRMVQGDDYVNQAQADRNSRPKPAPAALVKPIAQTLSEKCHYCKNKNKEMLFYPCGHLMSCEECSEFQVKCQCDSIIYGAVKIFIA